MPRRTVQARNKNVLPNNQLSYQECNDGVVQQIKENEELRAHKAQEDADYGEYQAQVNRQLDQLVAHRQLTEAQARKLHQTHLQQQMDYNTLLKI